MKFPGDRAQGSLEFISDQLGRGKVEKSDKKTWATLQKSDVPGLPWWKWMEADHFDRRITQ